MPRMYCPATNSQCKGHYVVSCAGANPISEFRYFVDKPSKSAKSVRINDDFYRDLLNNKDNPTEEEYSSIITLVKFLFNKLPANKKHLTLRAASIYYAEYGAILELEEGIVMDKSGDYINLHDHSNRSISYRGEMIK